ncbi:hypothetical protein APHAL10511_004553 [Amanita phalloides]|nr:hypothetical protein APHAL10511_004553 [Amanita phalloides]
MSTSPGLNRPPVVLNASSIVRTHTILAALAFSAALIVGSACHYKKIVQNGVAGYPQEWFPSVSAAIGDWYPERNIFQILIALTSGPRFLLVIIQYYCHRSQDSSLPTWVFVSGIIRTFTCGGWVYITSTDDHDVHDIFMISYILCNLPWMLGGITCTRYKNVRRRRKFVATTFFGTLIPLVYFFIRHKVHRIPGAYTHYAFFEWALIILDVAYDSITEAEFKEAEIQITLGTSLHMPVISDEIRNKSLVSNSDVPAMLWPDASTVKDNSTSWRSCLSFVSDLYLSYVFWSIFTVLMPTFFYFSIWELGIAGQELALLTTVSPLFMCIKSLRAAALTKGGLLVLNILSLSGLLAYALNSPLHRLFVVSFSSAIIMIRQVLDWTGLTGSNVTYQAVLMGLGLILSSLSKLFNHSNNPIWSFITEEAGGWNKTGIVLALAAISEHFLRDSSSEKNKHPLVTATNSHTLAVALPLGSLLFTLINLLGDSSTLIAWSWTGYENGMPRGPSPHLYGYLTFIAQALGLLLKSSNISSVSWFLYGAISASVLYRRRNWIGYIGGLNLTVFIMSIIPVVFQRAVNTRNPILTYSIAMFVYCLFHVAGVFTVAYAFVPGGEYFRERTDLMLTVQLLFLLPIFRWRRFSHSSVRYDLPGWARSYMRRTLAMTTVLSLLITMYRWPPAALPSKPEQRIINAGIWTVHFGFNNVGRDSQRGIKTLLQDMQLDIVGLLETDLYRPSFGQRDLTRLVVEDLGYYVDIGPGPNSHTWGAVLLSKFPIINSTHHLLPSPHGELAPAIEAVLDVYGTEVMVIVSHNGQEETPLDRELQSKELGRIMSAAYPKPAIFLGYVVTHPHAERPAPYKHMVEDGRMHDIDKDDTDRWCEYIFYRGLYRTAYARISRGIITDTEMQIGQFVLPKHGYPITNDTEEGRYLRASKEELAVEHWFPSEYYGNEHAGGKNRHFYHVFNAPLYFRLPDGAVV